MQCLVAKAFIASRSNAGIVIRFVPLVELRHEGKNFSIEGRPKKMGGKDKLGSGAEVVKKTEFIVVVVGDGKGSSPDTWGTGFRGMNSIVSARIRSSSDAVLEVESELMMQMIWLGQNTGNIRRTWNILVI
jgi:hypothetical protein